MLSSRGQGYATLFNTPWTFPPSATYDAQTNPKGLISFVVAEQALMKKELEAFVNKISLPYTQVFTHANASAGGPRFPRALATHINEYFKPYSPVLASDIKITDAVTSLNEALAFCLAERGDGVLISGLDFGNRAGVKIVGVDAEVGEVFEESVVARYEETLERARREGCRVRAVMVVNPHNPLGRCYPRSTLIALMRFCQSHNLHFISDEVYALSIHSGSPSSPACTSALSIDPTGIIDPDLVHVEYGMSKDFGAGGLKLGALITKNNALKSAIMANIRFHNPSGASLAIATAMLEDRVWCRHFIEASRRRITEAYGFITKRLEEIGVRYLEGSNAAFFVWMDLSPWLEKELGHEESERVLAKKFIDGGVFLQPGEEHAMEPGWFRLVFTMEREVVEEGLKRVEKVLRSIEGERKKISSSRH